MNRKVKKSHQLLFVHNILFFLFLCGSICTSHTNTIRAKSHISNDENFTEIIEECKRAAAADPNDEELGSFLVEILKSFGTELVDYVEYGDDQHAQTILREIKNTRECIALNEKSLANSGESPESLKKYMAGILFLAKDRHCESPDETFFNGQCLPISTRERSEHCPEHMGLYDDEKNEGFCYCLDLTREKAKSELRPIYSDETGFCHRQNTQGPCGNGEWFVLKNTPQCEPVPEGCSTDGQHVYWHPDPSKAKQCWEIWTQGPCEEGQILHLAQDTQELQVYCSNKLAESTGGGSIAYNIPKCPPLSNPNSFGQCVKPQVPGLFEKLVFKIVELTFGHSIVATNLAGRGTDIKIGHRLHKMMELLNLP